VQFRSQESIRHISGTRVIAYGAISHEDAGLKPRRYDGRF